MWIELRLNELEYIREALLTQPRVPIRHDLTDAGKRTLLEAVAKYRDRAIAEAREVY